MTVRLRTLQPAWLLRAASWVPSVGSLHGLGLVVWNPRGQDQVGSRSGGGGKARQQLCRRPVHTRLSASLRQGGPSRCLLSVLLWARSGQMTAGSLDALRRWGAPGAKPRPWTGPWMRPDPGPPLSRVDEVGLVENADKRIHHQAPDSLAGAWGGWHMATRQ